MSDERIAINYFIILNSLFEYSSIQTISHKQAGSITALY